MDWVSGALSRGPVLLGLAGTAAAVWAGVHAVSAVRADGDALVAEISGVIGSEREHRDALVALMERAEAGADAAVGCLLDDAKLALENRFDWKATVESLVGAANAAKTDPTEEGKRAAEDRVRLLWGSLMQKSVVHCAVSPQLAAVVRATVRVAMAAAAADRGREMTRSRREAASGQSALPVPGPDEAAVTEAIVSKLGRWIAGEATARLCESAEGRARSAMAAEPSTSGLVGDGPAPAAPGEGEAAGRPPQTRVLRLSALRRLVRAAGGSDAAEAVLRAALPPPRSSVASLRLGPSEGRAGVGADEAEDGAGGGRDTPSAAGAGDGDDTPDEAAEAAAERACLVALDVVDSPLGAAALRPALEGAGRRVHAAMRALLAELAASGSAAHGAEAEDGAAADDPGAAVGIVARKLAGRVAVIKGSDGLSAEDEALLRAVARRSFADLTGAHEAAAAARPAAPRGHADAMSALVADLVSGAAGRGKGR